MNNSFHLKELFIVISTILPSVLSFKSERGEPGSSWHPQQRAMCEQEGILPLSSKKSGLEDLSEPLKAFPYEKETRKLEASFCLCDQSQGGKILSRY